MRIIVSKGSREDELLQNALRNDGRVMLVLEGQAVALEIDARHAGSSTSEAFYVLEPEPSLLELETEIKAADEALTELQKQYRRLTGKDYRWFK